MTPQLARVARDGKSTHEQFYCPGCRRGHAYRVSPSDPACGPVWAFDGNRDRPTFSPSLLNHEVTVPEGEPAEWGSPRCHLFLNGGMIQFLPDCSHDHAGKTVPMVDWPEQYHVTFDP